VVATNGSIGGFKGGWGPSGLSCSEKIKLLREEGVHFDAKRVILDKHRLFREFSLV